MNGKKTSFRARLAAYILGLLLAGKITEARARRVLALIGLIPTRGAAA